MEMMSKKIKFNQLVFLKWLLRIYETVPTHQSKNYLFKLKFILLV